MQMDNVDFMVDSKTTNDVFHSNIFDVSEFSHIISGCHRLFYSQFTDSRVEFNMQQANAVAHALADEVVLSASPNIFFISVVVLMILLLMK